MYSKRYCVRFWSGTIERVFIRVCFRAGVGVSSLIGLKAQVAKKQSESKAVKDGTVSLAELRERQRYRGSLAALLNLPNPGVEKRRKKDEATGRQVYCLSITYQII